MKKEENRGYNDTAKEKNNYTRSLRVPTTWGVNKKEKEEEEEDYQSQSMSFTVPQK